MEKRAREQRNLHYLKPEETLLGLSLKYGVEGPTLCRLNRLPISTLSTTPHLVHTLPFVLLPPGASPSTSTAPLLSPEEERRRLILRRFQTRTRCHDAKLAKFWIDQVFDQREQESRWVNLNREARSRGRKGTDSGGSVNDEREDEQDIETETLMTSPRRGGELEEAVSAFLADERWEQEQRDKKAKGKGKSLYGSKLRSTGQVESVGHNKTRTWF